MNIKTDRVTGAPICQDCGKFAVRIGKILMCDCKEIGEA